MHPVRIAFPHLPDLLDFVELASGHIENESSNRIGVRNEGAVLDALDGLTHVLVQIGEGLGSPLGLDACLGLDTGLELVVGEGQHSAVRVVDEDDFLGAEQTLADGQRADLVIGDDSTSIANHVGFALAKPQNPVDIQSSVHAGNDGDVA